MQVKKQQLEPNIKVKTGSTLERSASRLYIVNLLFNLHADYMMQNSRLDEAEARIKTARKNIYTTDMQMIITLMAESEEELKSLLMKVKEETEKLA